MPVRRWGFCWRVKRRTFWCPVAEREVVVEFLEEGVPGFRETVAVKTCSAYEESGVVTCWASCLDPLYRLPGPPLVWLLRRRG